MKLPVIIVNFKSYAESIGANALELAKACQEVSKSHKVNIIAAPSFTDLQSVSSKIKIDVFSQHVDPVDAGQFTGHVTCLAVKESGAVGTLINHSERKLTLDDVGRCVELTKKYKLTSVCFASIPEEAERIAEFEPDFMAIEPPELIGLGISVSKARPDVVLDTVNLIKELNPKIKVLCGAGITTGEDVRKAIELGTVGVVVASGIVKAKDPKKVLIEFAKSVK